MRRFVTLMCLFSTSTLLITLASASSQPPPFCEAGAPRYPAGPPKVARAGAVTLRP
jgi:hypothetical protein